MLSSQIFIGSAMIALTVVIHTAGIIGLVVWFRAHFSCFCVEFVRRHYFGNRN